METMVGECLPGFPQGQCYCYEWMYRGGDDCSIKFCLNDCSENGQCKDGTCECNTNYYGEDCSVFVVTVLINARRLLASLVTGALLIALLFV